MSYEGEVIKWNDVKGLGFIDCRAVPKDVYVHHTAFGGGSMIVGEKVRFDLDKDREGRTRAINVEGPAVRKSGGGRGGGGGGGRRSRSRSPGRGGRSVGLWVVKMTEIDRDLDIRDVDDFFHDHKVPIVNDKVLMDPDYSTVYVPLKYYDDFDYVVRRLHDRSIGRNGRTNIHRSGDRDYYRALRRLENRDRPGESLQYKRGRGSSRDRRDRRRGRSDSRDRSRSRDRSHSRDRRGRSPEGGRDRSHSLDRRDRTPPREPEQPPADNNNDAAAPPAAGASRSRSRTPPRPAAEESDAPMAPQGDARERSRTRSRSRSQDAPPAPEPEA